MFRARQTFRARSFMCHSVTCHYYYYYMYYYRTSKDLIPLYDRLYVSRGRATIKGMDMDTNG